MGFLEIFLIGVGLAMDAFSVAICKGLKMPKLNIKFLSIIALFFGGFQALMPLLGYLLGTSFQKYFEKYGHFIAFILLAFIGGKMILESFGDGDEKDNEGLDIKELLILAVATSIDAFAVGVSFAFLDIGIFIPILIIGITTFIISGIGVIIGQRFGELFKRKANLLGGIILVLIGLKILLEGIGVIPAFGL